MCIRDSYCSGLVHFANERENRCIAEGLWVTQVFTFGAIIIGFAFADGFSSETLALDALASLGAGIAVLALCSSGGLIGTA